mgnify:CR=1 FL=1
MPRNEAKPAFYFSHILGILGELMQMAATYGYLVLKQMVCSGISSAVPAVSRTSASSSISMAFIKSMIDFGFAKEVRLYGLQEFLLGQFRRNKEHFYASSAGTMPSHSRTAASTTAFPAPETRLT